MSTWQNAIHGLGLGLLFVGGFALGELLQQWLRRRSRKRRVRERIEHLISECECWAGKWTDVAMQHRAHDCQTYHIAQGAVRAIQKFRRELERKLHELDHPQETRK